MARPKKGEEHPKKELGEKIRNAKAIGLTHEEIARALRIGTDTLHAHYQDELDAGKATVDLAIGGKIIGAALNGEQWAASLYAARRMGWKDTSKIEHEGGDPDKPIKHVIERRIVRPGPPQEPPAAA
jgi:hypothetical protein